MCPFETELHIINHRMKPPHLCYAAILIIVSVISLIIIPIPNTKELIGCPIWNATQTDKCNFIVETYQIICENISNYQKSHIINIH